MNTRRNGLLIAAALLTLLAVAGILSEAKGLAVNAAFPAAQASAPGAGVTSGQAVLDDGLDKVPPLLRGLSYSTLVAMGRAHYPAFKQEQGQSTWRNPLQLVITWGAEHQTGASAGEPAAGMHPTNGNYALVSGNFSLDHTTDGGNTWASIQPPNPHNSGDVTNVWLEGGPGPSGANALEMSINFSGGYDYTCGRSTDFGVTWTTDAACGPSVSTPYFDDREYIWADHNPASPFYGRAYVTTALFDAGGSGSFNTVSNRWSSDNGTTWNPPSAVPIALVPNNEFALGQNHNEFPSLGISPNGTLGYLWHRGACCGQINVPNKVMFARSADGGVTFPFSTTVVTVPLNQTVSFNSTSPLGTRWSDTPNIAADPATNGTFYAIWTQYRTANVAASAAIYLSKTTDNGVTWSAPVIPYNNPNANIFQGFGWVKVTTDHAIHVTYTGGTTSNTVVAQWYVQSTDGGTTWSAPFQLSSTTFGPFGTTTDYEAMDVSGVTGGPGSILATWAESGHYARIGTFVQGTPTPTVTGTPPTATPSRTFTTTPTRTNTATITPTPTCGGPGSIRVLIAYADLGGPPTTLQAQILAEPGVSAVNLFDAASGTPTLAQLQQYTAVVAFSNNQYANAVGMGDVLADYEDGGGIVVGFNFDWYGAPFGLAGRWMTGGYTPFNTGPTLFSNSTLGTFTPGHPLMAGVTTLNGYFRHSLPLAAGAVQVAAWADSVPLIAYKVQAGHTAVGINNYIGENPNMWSGQFGRVVVNAVRWLAPGTPCGSVSPTPTAPSATPTATPTCGGPGAWRLETPVPTAVAYAAGAVVANQLYVLTGFNGSAYSAATQRFDPATNTWTQLSPIPTPHSQSRAAAVGTKIYVPGGYNSVQYSGPLTSMQIYDTVAGTWSQGAPLPAPRSGAGVAAYNGKVYIIAGFAPGFVETNTVYEYDPVANTYTTKAPMPGTAGNMPAVTLGNLIYAVGGTAAFAHYAYDPAANTWATIAAGLTTDAQGAGGFALNGEVWVVGGNSQPANQQVQIYNPGTNSWRFGPLFNIARTGSSATGTINGRGYVVGGNGPLNSMESIAPPPCGTATPTATPTTPPSGTPTQTATAPPSNTPTQTVQPSATPTLCALPFTDVDPYNPFYVYIRCLYCRGIISGYNTTPPCATTPCFMPYNNITRGQVAKIVVLAAGFTDPIPTTQQTFTDVPYGSPFWIFVERAALHGVISGYSTNPPCVTGVPCFLPNNALTRGQLAKIASQAAGYSDPIPSGTQTFDDVDYGNAFWVYVERLSERGIISGYDGNGSTINPCTGLVEQLGHIYYRWCANITRGQTAKIVANTFFPINCAPGPVRRDPSGIAP